VSFVGLKLVVCFHGSRTVENIPCQYQPERDTTRSHDLDSIVQFWFTDKKSTSHRSVVALS